jgi:proteasome assembly chaperone (PAC2) family protein
MTMAIESIVVDRLPSIKTPILIAGFEGWGNAMDVSRAMVNYLVRQLNATPFAKLNSDLFYQYDVTRPYINIENGKMKELSLPGGTFYAAQSDPEKNGILLLDAHEPNLRWSQFADALFSLMDRVGAHTLITIGSLYDKVLHSERNISAIAYGVDLERKLLEKNIEPISYQGSGAIHSLLHWEGVNRKYACASIWCHCPYYLQGTAHYGFLESLGAVLSYLGGFDLDLEELTQKWEKLHEQIDTLVANNSDIQNIIEELKSDTKRLRHQSIGTPAENSNKVINLKDFLDP